MSLENLMSTPKPIMDALSGSESIHIDAPAERIWDLVADITRMGEWSPETISAKWLSGFNRAHPGAKFRAVNKARWIRWQNTCTVVVAEKNRELAFLRPGLDGGCTWSFSLDQDDNGNGTTVTESFTQQHAPPRAYRALVGVLLGPGRMDALQNGMRTTLRRLKTAAELT